MSGRGLALLLALCAGGVAALGVGACIYGSLLPGAQRLPEGSGCFLVVTVGLVVSLVGGAVWVLRRRPREGQPELDDRLRGAVLGDPGGGPEARHPRR